jgi:hypothetical protein
VVAQTGNNTEVVAKAVPRLLYIGDVPVESTVYGSALLYRLLRHYPADKLLVLEGSHSPSTLAHRLPNVRYSTLPIGIGRLINSRFGRFYGTWLLCTAEDKCQDVARLANSFNPEAVLSVTHGFSWLAAAAYAEKYALPLHLILHDEWVKNIRAPEWLCSRMDKKFGAYYRQAVSRLCVSPYMAQKYKRQYGADGQILYPSHAPDTPYFDQPPSRLVEPKHNPVFAYGGTINSIGSAKILRRIAEILATLQGKLLIFGPVSLEQSRNLGLNLPNIMLRGLISSKEMIHCFRDEADVLVLPVSFDRQDSLNVEINFPSKLTDYTAAGVPILICGPTYSSAVQWANENPGVAEVVESERMLEVSVQRMAVDIKFRMSLAQKALDLGRQVFSHSVAVTTFHNTLCTTRRCL